MLTIAIFLALAPTQKAQPQPPPPPLIRMPTQAPASRWTSTDEGDYTEAFTTNDTGSTFGILCGSNCVFYIDFQIACDDGHFYPAMINSSAGALQIRLRCHVVDKRYVFSTAATEDYFDILERGGEIGFALPLASGRFNVSRFSLAGSLNAVSRAVAAAVKKRNESQEGLRDFTI